MTQEILLIGDVHLSDKAPSSCTESYNDDLFDLLKQCSEIAYKRNVFAVIQAGDLFHVKTPSRTSHKTVHRTIDLLKSFPCPFYVVPGNHDLFNDRLESLNETQPLGVLAKAGAVTLLDGWADDMPVYGVPWQQEWSDEVVAGRLQDFREEEFSDGCLLVTHAPLYPPSTEPFYEYYPTSKWADFMGNSGYVYYGHIHEPHGEYAVSGVTFCNNGALSRGSLHEYNLNRELLVTSWKSDTGEFEKIPISHKPASEVFRLAEVLESETRKAGADEFLHSVGETVINQSSIETLMQHVSSLSLDQDIKTEIKALLEWAESSEEGK